MILTCGHGVTVNTSVSLYGNVIGTVSMVQLNNLQSGDYSFINCSNGYTSSPDYYTSPYGTYATYTGYYYNPPAGTYLYKFGHVTGQGTCTVKYTGVSLSIDSKTITNMTMAEGTAQHGDSGGLYRYGNMFCGVHSGHLTVDKKDYVCFTPYIYPYSSGFTICTSTS